MSHIETANHNAAQSLEQPFRAKICDIWGVWVRLLNRDHLKGAFSREEDARAFARKAAGPQMLAEVRQMRVIMNLDANEAYPLGEPKDRLRAIDVDFMHHTRMQNLRAQALSRLSEDELAALGLRKG